MFLTWSFAVPDGMQAVQPPIAPPDDRAGVHRVGDGFNEANADISGLVALCEQPVAAFKSRHSLRPGAADKQGNAKSRGGQGEPHHRRRLAPAGRD
jgi:hypothetical protein